MIIHQLVSEVDQVIQRENTEVSVKANAYLDQWRPIYPIELREYAIRTSFQNNGYFSVFLY
jgi:hypothetical protein